MKPRGTLRSIVSVTLWKALGTGLSLAIALAIANLFGATASTDAFFVARRVVSNIAAALERAIQLIQVPPLVRLAELQGLAALRSHLRLRGVQLLLVFLPCTALAFLLAPQILAWLAPGLTDAQLESAVLYFRIFIVVLPISALTALIGATLNALRLFSIPVIARLLPRACAVVALALVPVFGYGLGGPALAIAAGTILMGLVFSVSIRRALTSVRTVAETTTPPAPYAKSRVWAMLLAQFHVICASWIDMAVASFTGAGGVSTLEFAQRMTNMVPGVVTNSVVVVYYTEFASSIARGEMEGFRQTIQASLRASLLFVLPVAAALFVLGEPLVGIFLGHGAFDDWAVGQTAAIVSLLAPLLIVNSCLGTVVSAIFADPRVPHVRIIVSSILVSLAVRVAVNVLLFPQAGILAVPTASLISMSVLLLQLYVRLSLWTGPPVRLAEAGPFAAMVVAGLAACLVIWATQGWGAPHVSSRVGMLALAALASACGAVVFFVLAAVCNVPETARLKTAIGKAMRRRQA